MLKKKFSANGREGRSGGKNPWINVRRKKVKYVINQEIMHLSGLIYRNIFHLKIIYNKYVHYIYVCMYVHSIVFVLLFIYMHIC